MSSRANPAVLAPLLRRAREAQGWTVVDLAQVTGLPLRSLSRWENGGAAPNDRSAALVYAAYRNIDPELAAELAVALCIPPEAMPPPAPPPAPPALPSAPAPPPARALDVDVFELSTLLVADALDVTPSRLRDALAKVVPLWRAAGLTLDDVQAKLPPPKA